MSSNWISVEVEVPKVSGEYFVCFNNKVVATLEWDRKNNEWYDSYYPAVSYKGLVSYWQPLPEPPK